MKNYRRSLPPLDSLIFFEAAARRLSFSEAAEELLVTQTAVSKRVRQLEAHLGVALFLRAGRMIELTESGRKLAGQCATLLDFTESALSGIAARPDTPVRIAANSAVSLFWLSPRLKRFELSDLACPVELVASDQPSALLDSANDIAILHGSGAWPGRVSAPLFPDVLVPVISPGLARTAGIGPGEPLSRLLPQSRPPLLNFPRLTPEWTNWDNWGEAAEVGGWARADCGTYARSIGAALEGRGIALASPAILASELASGALIRLGPAAQSPRLGYFLSHSAQQPPRAEAARLTGFLSDENAPDASSDER
ncbi:LysR family transcriptional regulator [Cribrihabitans pelagius]|uniref:LysR family transcriptional regulator n=1 Tax=Cribrihabitans pelagius TaxID=1765746 RepID=UPI003B598CB4